VAGILLSQQTKIMDAVAALEGWSAAAEEVGVRVTQVNLETLPDPDNPDTPKAQVVFEWNPDAGEYSMRTGGTAG